MSAKDTFTVRTVNEVFRAGGCADGRLALVGVLAPDIVACLFDPAGDLVRVETASLEPPPSRSSSTGPYRMLTPELEEAYQQQVEARGRALQLHESPIELRPFDVADRGVALIAVPEHLEDTSWAETVEERTEADADREDWIASGCYVLRWGAEFYMSADGEVEAT